jgi:hypothetical protein
MICIACDTDKEELAKSHVISNFVRKWLTGELGHDGRKQYKFKWVGRNDLPRQDLPKPYLMCEKCDTLLGSIVERGAPSLLMPNDVDNFGEWEKLPIKPMPLHGVFDDPLWLGVYEYPECQQSIIDKFAISTAWRALHSLSKEGRELSIGFLTSERGENINKLVIGHLFRNQSLNVAPRAALYYLGPESVTFISNNDDEFPFAWAEIGENEEFLGVAVMFAYWVILWPLFDHDPIYYFDRLEKLEKICFMNWAAKIKSELKAQTEASKPT